MAGNEREFQEAGTAKANALQWKAPETISRKSKDVCRASEKERKGCGQKAVEGCITPYSQRRDDFAFSLMEMGRGATEGNKAKYV